MSASNTWRGDRDGFVADDFRFSVGHETLRAEGPGGGHDGFVQGRERDKHAHAHAHVHAHSPIHPHYNLHNSYPHSFNDIHNTSGEVGQEEDIGNSYLISTVSITSHNPSFFPELSVSPTPEPEAQPYTQQTAHSSPVSSVFDSSVASSPVLGAQDCPDTEHDRFLELGPPFFSTFHSQPNLVPQQTLTTSLKRKRGRPPKNPAAHTNSRRHPFCTFKNGFAMSFTAEDDYRSVADDEFDNNTRLPIEDAITLDPKKRAEKQRAPPATAAATRGRRQVKPSAASAGPTLAKVSVKKGKATSAKSVKATPPAPAGRRASGRAKRATNKAAPKYNVGYSDDDDDGSEDEEDDENDNFSGPSNSNSSDEDEDNDEVEDEEEDEDSHPERVTSAGHSLRARGKLARPDRLKEYVSIDSALRRGVRKKKSGSQQKGKHSGKYTRLGRGLSCQHCHGKRIRCDGKQPTCGNCVRYEIDCISRIWVNGKAEVHLGEEVLGEDKVNTKGKATTTQREDIRQAIHEGATKKRHNFFRAYEHLFLPLLPEKNFITKLKETEEKGMQREKEQGKKGEAKGEAIDEEKSGVNQTLGEALERNEGNVAEEVKHEAVPYRLLEEQPSGYVMLHHDIPWLGMEFR